MRALLAGLLVLLGAAAPAPAGGEESERAWHGILPDREQTLGTEEQPRSRWYACRILDAETGKPVPGARFVRTPEWIAGGRLRHDVVMSVGTADRDGIAHVAVEAAVWRTDSHWIAAAPGYAPAYEYGVVPPAEMLLSRGEPCRGRVLDPMGRPVAGATVEVLGGCSHGTATARAKTGADGTFAFERLDPSSSGQLWVEGPGIASDLLAFASQRSLGGGAVLLAMGAGTRYEGRVVDLLGEPVPHAVVRAWNEQRGPATATREDGAFVLDGVEGRQDFQVLPPFDLTEEAGPWYVKDAHPGVPATIVVGPLGVVEEEETARVLVRARTKEGAPVGGVAFLLARGDDGRGPTGVTADEEPVAGDDPPLGADVVDARPGTHRLLPSDPFGEHTFDPAEVRAAAGETTGADVVVRPRPRLRIAGEVPESASLILSVPGESKQLLDGAESKPALPASGDAVLRVEVEDRPPFFFPVGPVTEEGLREVVVRLPAPRIVLLPPDADHARLLDGEREAFAVERGESLVTDATGVLTLRWRDAEDEIRETAVEVPAEEGALVSAAKSPGRPVVREVVVRAVGPGDDAGAEHRETAEPGETVVIRRDGWRTLRAVAPPEGETVLRWGTATLRLAIEDEDGQPVDALVLAADEVHEAPEGRLELRGFDPGPVRVVVARRDVVGEGRELRFLLEAGATRERKVVLPSD